MTDVSEVLIVSIIVLMMDAVSTSEMAVNLYQTTIYSLSTPDNLTSHAVATAYCRDGQTFLWAGQMKKVKCQVGQLYFL
jgi:hypothetical protein